ncbi:MAG: hypothetical protein QW756_05605 [Nitrososphaerota archaeon]
MVNGTETVMEVYKEFVKIRPDRQAYLVDVDGVLAVGKCFAMTAE